MFCSCVETMLTSVVYLPDFEQRISKKPKNLNLPFFLWVHKIEFFGILKLSRSPFLPDFTLEEMIPPIVVLLCDEELEFIDLGGRETVCEDRDAVIKKGVESNFYY